jgi:hypothetical protein
MMSDEFIPSAFITQKEENTQMEKEEPKAGKDSKIQREENDKDDIPVCNYAPEWSEHARFDRADEPCDDGRMGGRRCIQEGEACPVTEEHMPENT